MNRYSGKNRLTTGWRLRKATEATANVHGKTDVRITSGSTKKIHRVLVVILAKDTVFDGYFATFLDVNFAEDFPQRKIAMLESGRSDTEIG